MKKLLTTLLAASVVFSMFSGCGSSASSSGTTDDAKTKDTASASSSSAASGEADVNDDGTVNNPESVKAGENDLVYWSLFSGGDGDYMDKIIEEYNATGPAKKVVSVKLVWADYYTKLATAVAAGKGPDIGVSHVSKLPELVSQGIVMPFDEYADKSGVDWSQYSDSMVKAVTFDDEKYAIPLDTHAEIMYYNKDLLKDSGLLNEDGTLNVGSNEQEFKASLDKLKSTLPEGVSALALPSKGDDPYRIWWATYFQMGGTPLINEDGTEVTLDKDIAAKAIEFVKSFYDDGYCPVGIEDHGKYFQGGQGAIFFGGTWCTGTYESQDGFNFGAQAYPNLFNTDACWADSHTLTIPTNKSRTDEETQAAVDFINYASSKGGLTWAGSGQIPANQTVINSQEYKDLPFRSSYADAAKVAVYPSKSEYFYSIKDLLIKQLDTAWAGTATTDEIVANITDEIKTTIE